MRIIIEDRVEQAFRHLQPSEADKVAKILSLLEHESIQNLRSRFKIHKLSTPDENVFVIQATSKLRILFKYDKDQTLLIEDIVSHDVLEKFFRGRHG
jgi:mRNA-degrading endonuclease YafQ of YafQ-DinJ toxin-antitoxin module